MGIMDILCSSPASTAICSGFHQRPMVRHSTGSPAPSSRRKSSADVSDLHRMINYRHRPRESDNLLSNSTLARNQSAKEPRHLMHAKLIKPSSSSQSRGHHVVVLRMSLHCKGCEAKLRKHISKMEGVSSFSIEMESKKVTIIGNVTPSSVLASVSTVKNAQLWPTSSPAKSSRSTSSPSASF